MEENINKIVELEIDLHDLELDDMGVDVVSLVTEPAIEVDFLAFQKEEDLEKVHDVILDWANENGEELVDEYIYIDEKEFSFESATAVQRAVQGLGILGKLGIRKDEPAEIKYKYSGPRDSSNRGFCGGMLRLNKMYSMNDIITLKSKLGTLNPNMGRGGADTYNVFAYKGGVSCRHFWSEVAVFRNQNGRVVVIERGPAAGLAGKDNNSARGGSPNGSVSNNASISKQFSFAIQDEEKRIVAGPLMIPNQMILRRDPEGNPYYVYFSKDTVRKIQERFNRDYKINNTDVQHDGNVHTDNIMLEQWIIEHPNYDKSKFYGFDRLPLGSWFGTYKINNDKDWERVKSGELRGFSIAGNFIEKAKEVETADERTLDQIINILREIK